MNKESWLSYLLRLLLSMLILILMGMLYWSSLINEERFYEIETSLKEIKKNFSSFKSSPPSIQNEISSVSLHPKLRPYMDSKFPNILIEDPFYTKTLPQLLGAYFIPQGKIQSATIGRPNNLSPFSNFAEVASWQDLCLVTLARLSFGKYDVFSPDMAIKIEARPLAGYDDPDAVEYWVHLRDDIYWHPLESHLFSPPLQLAPIFSEKHQVTAEDFAFYFDAISNRHVEEPSAVALRTYYDDVESINVLDPLTLVVRWKVHDFTNEAGKTSHKIKYQAKSLTCGLQPLPRFVFQRFADGSKILEEDINPNSYRTSTVWAQNFAQHWAKNIIVSCGAWNFAGMSDREIQFERNPNFPYPLRALTEENTVLFEETPENIWQSFENNKIDSYSLQPDQLALLTQFLKSKNYQTEKAKGNGINRLDFLGRSYAYIGWNQANPLFASKKIRQALTMAIDRKRIINDNLNGLGVEITCPFYRYSSSYDETIPPWPYDLVQARRFLEDEGWYDSDGDGVIDKEIDGKRVPFKFTLTYFVKNSINKSICEYVSTNLKQLGIDCKLNGVEIADLSSAFDDKTFDAISLGWALSVPPEDPKQLWYSAGAKEKGSSNAVGFSNVEADKIINALQYESDPTLRQKLYFQFDAIINEEAPYTFLYSPKIVFLTYDYLQNVFIPKDRKDLIPDATAGQPDSSAFWIKRQF